jgi:hypothetical protein
MACPALSFNLPRMRILVAGRAIFKLKVLIYENFAVHCRDTMAFAASDPLVNAVELESSITVIEPHRLLPIL